MNITSAEYWKQVKAIATDLAQEAVEQARDNDASLCDDELKEPAEELIIDTLLHETIDGHEWIIYCSYNLDVIQHSDNEDYMQENFGDESLGESLKQGGLSGLHTAIAFWALYADVQDCIDDALDSELSED